MSRSVYQTSGGGEQYVPLETGAGLFEMSTPRFAQMLSWKYGQMSSASVQEDMLQNHKRAISTSYIQKISYSVGDALLVQESSITYQHGIALSQVKAVSVGRDGVMMRMQSGAYEEAMVGTLSLIGAERKVLHTIYVGDSPEKGKEGFDTLLHNEIVELKKELSHVTWEGCADGSAHNWKFLSQYVDVQVIDWWHAWQYIHAALALCYEKPDKLKQNIEKWKDKLQKEANSVGKLLAFLRRMATCRQKTGKKTEEIQKAITYLDNHKHQMNYAQYLEDGLLIGSGVTESACKTFIKLRFGGCGMKWNAINAQLLTLIRGLTLTNGRWTQAWVHLIKNRAKTQI